MSKNTESRGIGLTTVLTLIFVVLKCVGVINWSWWWVLSPTLISLGLCLIAVAIYVALGAHYNKKYGLTSKKGKKDKWKF